jgi:hypothetical protein
VKHSHTHQCSYCRFFDFRSIPTSRRSGPPISLLELVAWLGVACSRVRSPVSARPLARALGEIVKNLVTLFFLQILLFLILPLSATAQDLPNLKSSYWTTANIALIALDATAKSADMGFTERNAGRANFRENDPLARPFVHSGPILAGVSEGLLFAGEVCASYELFRHRHAHMAKALLLTGIGGNTIGVATSTH